MNGGSVDSSPIGATTPAAGAFITLSTTAAATFGGGYPSVLFAFLSNATGLRYFKFVLDATGTLQLQSVKDDGLTASATYLTIGPSGIGSNLPVSYNSTFSVNGAATFKGAVLEPGLQIVAAVAAGSVTIAQTTSTLVLNPSGTIASYGNHLSNAARRRPPLRGVDHQRDHDAHLHRIVGFDGQERTDDALSRIRLRTHLRCGDDDLVSETLRRNREPTAAVLRHAPRRPSRLDRRSTRLWLPPRQRRLGAR